MATKSVHKSRKSRAAAPARIRIPETAADRIRIELSGAKAATMMAILAVENKGMFDEVGFSLRRHVLLPLEAIIDALKQAGGGL